MSAFRQALAGLLTAGASLLTVMGAVLLADVESGGPGGSETALAAVSPSATSPIGPTPGGMTTSAIPSSTSLPTSSPTIPPTATPLPSLSPTLSPTPFQVLPTPCRPPSSWVPIQVQPGDTLFRLALHYGLTVSIMQSANCLPTSYLIAGTTLYVPGQVATPVRCGPPPGWVFYTVQRGDNLFRLSLRYGVTLYALQQANCISNPSGIYAGQRLYVPPVQVAPPTATATPIPTATPAPSATPVPPTPIPPTPIPPTPVPPTDVPPPTSTTAPTPTPTVEPPTSTPTATETASPVPPTDTPTATPTGTPG